MEFPKRRGRKRAQSPADASDASDRLDEAGEAAETAAAGAEAEAGATEAIGAGPGGSAGATQDPDEPPAKRSWSGTRLVALIAGVAVASLLIGVAVMQFIVSPAEIAARTKAPEAGPVTAPVEEREIENTVVTRGEVTYADAVQVTIDATGGEDRPVVTGHVPEVGAVLDTGGVALEVAGRPVMVLPGELPAYRTLSIGMRGPDVTQLKAALGAMGFGAGDPASDTYEYDTAIAVGALYEQLGFAAPDGGSEAQQMLRDAQRALRDAELAAAQAQDALNQAAADDGRSVGDEQNAVNSAYDAVTDAQESLAEAQEAVLPTLPSSEVLFLSGLPRRVDEISVKRGDILSGSPMSVSGATLTIVGTVSQQDAELLTEGATAYYPGPDGTDLTATVQKITAPGSSQSSDQDGGDQQQEGGGTNAQSGGSRYTVELVPDELTPEQVDALRDTNVRVRVPVASTDGKVLAVPIAALSSGSGGEDRVELLIDVKKGSDAETENIAVTAGLAADGFVEISSDDPRIVPGAKVVVGR